jgi:hypothetical protein
MSFLLFPSPQFMPYLVRSKANISSIKMVSLPGPYYLNEKTKKEREEKEKLIISPS